MASRSLAGVIFGLRPPLRGRLHAQADPEGLRIGASIFLAKARSWRILHALSEGDYVSLPLYAEFLTRAFSSFKSYFVEVRLN